MIDAVRYDLAGLGSEQFERLCQALAVKVLGSSVQVFGAGPDGGREAIFEGPLWCPGTGSDVVWDGYGVLQAKYKQTLSKSNADLTWLKGRIKAELDAWADPAKRRNRDGRLPQYLVFATNVSLSAVPGRGGKDRIEALIAGYADRLTFKGWAVWDAVQIMSLLDAHEEITRSFAALITPSTVLAALHDRITTIDTGTSTHANLRPLSNLPPRNPHFASRDDLILHIEHQLAVGPVAVVAMHGLGGTGKSQLAMEIAYRGRIAGRYDHAWWVRAQNPATMVEDLAALAPAVGLTPMTDQRQQAVLVLRELQHRGRWIVVFDNATSADALREWLPSGTGDVLITSRDRDWGGLAHPLVVGEFTPRESVAFLQQRIGQSGEPVQELAATLGDLPLALAQAASYMDRHGLSVAGYLALYRDREGAGRLLASGIPGYPASVATTWLNHFERLQAETPAALELLRLCAFVNPDAIDFRLVLSDPRRLRGRLTAGLARSAGKPAIREETIGALISSGLAIRLGDERIRLHRLVSQVTRHHVSTSLGEDEAKAWALHALKLLAALAPDDPSDPQSWPVMADLVPHILAAVDHTPPVGVAADALTDVGQYLESRAQYGPAEAVLRRALAISEGLQIQDHQATARTLGSLAIVQLGQGELHGARSSHLRALKIYETIYSPDHLEVARTLNNLGIVHRLVRDLDAAQSSHERALAIYETVHGPDHPAVARTLNNLANTQDELGQLDTARATLHRALAIKEAVFGPDHLEMAFTLGNLGVIEQELGELDLAHAHQSQAIAIFKAAYGHNHPEVAVALTNLGIVEDLIGALDASRASYLRALAIFESVYPQGHYEIARTLTNLGKVELRLGEIDTARHSAQRAVAIFQVRLGPTHPHTKAAAELLSSIPNQS